MGFERRASRFELGLLLICRYGWPNSRAARLGPPLLSEDPRSVEDDSARSELALDAELAYTDAAEAVGV
jgi:hypothetical protein